jgi:hypothetical protein
MALTLSLRPEAALPWMGQASVHCRDPSCYWLGELADAQAVRVQGKDCAATLEAPRDAPREASPMQAAAIAPGAWPVPNASPPRPPRARLRRCGRRPPETRRR